MLPKISTLPLSEGDILHRAKLVSGYWSFIAPFCIMSRMIFYLLICGYVLELHCYLLHHVLDEVLPEAFEATLLYDLRH